MQQVNLGSTGLKVSRLCLGMMTYGSKNWREWVLSEEEGRPIIRRAVELGFTFFDTADVYSIGASEEITGRALKEFGPPREQVVVATKVHGAMGETPNERGLSRKHILHSIDASLRRLQLDYVDLYQIHRFDPTTPIEETIEALHDVVRAGKALHIGASSMYAWQFARYLHAAERMGMTRFVTMQNHYNLIYREEEREMIPLCRAEGIGIIPWSPLARGFLVGNRGPDRKQGGTLRSRTDAFGHGLYWRDDDFQVVDALTQVAKRRGVPNAQVALAWILAQPGVTAPIIGASKLAHLEDAAKAMEIQLTAEELEQLAARYQPHPVLGHT